MKIEEVIELLKDLCTMQVIIVVEGKRDKDVLQALGIERVEDISGKVIEEVVEDVCKIGNEVLILTDFDKEGMRLERVLSKEFEARKVKVLSKLRSRIRRKFGSVRKIEEMGKVLRLTEYRANEKVLNRVKTFRRMKSQAWRRGYLHIPVR